MGEKKAIESDNKEDISRLISEAELRVRQELDGTTKIEIERVSCEAEEENKKSVQNAKEELKVQMQDEARQKSEETVRSHEKYIDEVYVKWSAKEAAWQAQKEEEESRSKEVEL